MKKAIANLSFSDLKVRYFTGRSIPVEDEFFKLWHQKIFQLGSIFRKAEKVCSDHTMELAWSATFVELYGRAAQECRPRMILKRTG